MIAAAPDAHRRYPRSVDPIIWENEAPELSDPVLVATFSGWNDAASAASAALGAVADSLDNELIARIDPEDFYDFQATRPQIELTEGRLRGVAWPENLIVAGRSAPGERDLLMISGTEPGTHWRTFCNSLLDVAERCGVSSMVTLGALIADVAHTRPVPITGLATTDELIERLGFEDVAYEGPTGIVGVLHHMAKERDFTAASLWAAVPHYAAAVPNPKAALALLRRLEGLIGLPLDAGELEDASKSFEAQVTDAVAANPEIKELVERLETQQDDLTGLAPDDVPSGDAIAKDFQDFLRRQGE
jgi:proteasome assembly chaperone (PAC2) family protein